MNQIEPYELNGKTIKDCYESRDGLVIEFTDGIMVVLAGDNRFYFYNGRIEIKKKYV